MDNNNDNNQQQQSTTTSTSMIRGWLRADCERAQLEMVRDPSRFPQKLRGAIEINRRWDPERFCFVIYEILKGALLWVPSPPNADVDVDASDREWGGFDSRIDSEAEIEAAVRLFPQVLDETVLVNFPMRAALLCPYTIAFVPLLADLGQELSRNRTGKRGGLMNFALATFPQRGGPGQKPGTPFLELVSSDYRLAGWKDDKHGDKDGNSNSNSNSDSDPARTVEETVSKALARLIHSGLIDTSDVRLSVNKLLRYKWPCSKTTLRTLIECDPTTLTESYRDPWSSSLTKHLHSYNFFNWKGLDKRQELDIFEVLFEMGLEHYPEEMGHLFSSRDFRTTSITQDPHGPGYRDHYAGGNIEARGTPLDIACAVCGRDETMAMIERVLSKFVREMPHSVVSKMVRQATTSHWIGLDALYLLCRRDPVAISSPSGWIVRAIFASE